MSQFSSFDIIEGYLPTLSWWWFRWPCSSDLAPMYIILNVYCHENLCIRVCHKGATKSISCIAHIILPTLFISSFYEMLYFTFDLFNNNIQKKIIKIVRFFFGKKNIPIFNINQFSACLRYNQSIKRNNNRFNIYMYPPPPLILVPLIRISNHLYWKHLL